MSDPYERAKGERLTFKGGTLATLKSIDKKQKKKKKKTKSKENPSEEDGEAQAFDNGDGDARGGLVETDTGGGVSGGEVYTIDASKRMKYDELFPVEAKKFRYEPKSNSKSVEDALDDRVKKKADRYCK